MTARQVGWRACYELLAVRVRKPEWAFMNYGYAPLTSTEPHLSLEAADEPDRLCIQLYDQAIGGTDLRDRDVLEVGSGRGGGSSYLARYRQPATITGLDFSASAVALSKRHRHAPGLTFVRGDAQEMPFPDASFDAVVNIESSHCYGSMETFLAEVHRILRPGGVFLFADFRDCAGAAVLRRQLDDSALTLEQHRDITAHVVEALRLDSARKVTLIDEWIPRIALPAFRRFAGIEGTVSFARFASGDTRYVSARSVKAGPRRS